MILNHHNMKSLLVLVLLSLPTFAFSQIGVNYHQSNLPFVGINYEIKEKFRPELRIAVDQYFEDLDVEGVVTYDFIEKEEFEFYAGVGARVEQLSGVVVPIGLNIFPFERKAFGFHIEVAPLIGESVVLRGSWGIRYQFNRGRSL